jgi:DNA processing protein
MIYYRGNLNYDYNRSIAVIGTRAPDEDGRKRAAYYSSRLVAGSMIPVSGLALGIDSMAHQEAVRKKQPTLAVLGCGIDRVYPAVHKELAREILDQGGAVLSEYPPGFQARRWYFPRRNRIIVGLSRAVLIVQSPENSGSRISGFLAADYNRDLFVCEPDNNHSPVDEGNRIMIRSGGTPVRSPEEVLKELVYSQELM